MNRLLLPADIRVVSGRRVRHASLGAPSRGADEPLTMGNRYRLFVGRTVRTSRPSLFLGRDWRDGVPSEWLAIGTTFLRGVSRDDLEFEAETFVRARFRGRVDVVNAAAHYGTWRAYAPDGVGPQVEFTVEPWD